jgi:sulfonate transport system substrate-binding protein
VPIMRTRIRKFQVALCMTSIVSLLPVISALSACTKADQKSAWPPEKVTIAYSASPDAALAQVAQAKGYYLQEGLDATLQIHPYGKVALDAMLEGKADFATVAETPVMFAVMQGRKVSIIATIQTSSRNVAIVARKDKGILTPRDLKGRTIAVTSGTLLDFFTDAFLVAQGMPGKDMTVVHMLPEEMAEAVERGTVDAIAAWSHVLIQTQKRLGEKGITFYDEDVYMQTFNVVTTQDYIRTHPENVKKVLRALIKAEKFTDQKPAEAQTIVADFTNLDKAVIAEMWPVENFNVTLDQSLLLALEDESQWATKSGLTGKTKIPNFLNFIYLDGLQSVKPDAVRMLQ